jgi:hypothetical protein
MSSGAEKMPEKWIWHYPFPGILPGVGGSFSKDFQAWPSENSGLMTGKLP